MRLLGRLEHGSGGRHSRLLALMPASSVAAWANARAIWAATSGTVADAAWWCVPHRIWESDGVRKTGSVPGSMTSGAGLECREVDEVQETDRDLGISAWHGRRRIDLPRGLQRVSRTAADASRAATRMGSQTGENGGA
jgi:hypothetical protein